MSIEEKPGFVQTKARLRLAALCLFVSTISASPLLAATIEIFPGDSFKNAAEALQPGDELIVHEGTYTHTSRISVTVAGTPAEPVVIRGADGEARPKIQLGVAGHNTIEIVGASYLTIRGLEFTANNLPGADGVNLNGNPSYITLEDLEIHDISVGINFRSSMHHITVRGNHIYNTNDTGEGMYVGCHDASCTVSDSLIENNWVHDTYGADQGDGIEIKRGSHSNIIRDNVVHDTNYPCIILYGTEGNPRNIVERNVMWNCSAGGFQVAADTVLRNNIVFAGSNDGLISQYHAGVTPNNLEFVNNTIIGGSPCLRLSGWDNKSGMVFANNAIYCGSNNYSIGGAAGVTVSGNVFDVRPSAFPAAGNLIGRSAAEDFVDTANLNAYPSSDSTIIGAGDAARSPADDFNGSARSGAVDAGAYAWVGAQNPGWAVGPGFKDQEAGPAIVLTADPTVVAYQGETRLEWQATNAVTCSAEEGWAGPKPLSGNEVVTGLMADTSFALRCSSAGGIDTLRSVNVTVTPPQGAALTLDANASVVEHNGTVVLTWSGSNVADCEAAGDWSGTKPDSGSETVGPLQADSAFDLTCGTAGAPISRSVQVTVSAAPPPVDPPDNPPDDPSADDDSGGGSLFLSPLLLLLVRLTRAVRLRRRRDPLAVS